MKYSIGKMISKSIKENKWLSIILDDNQFEIIAKEIYKNEDIEKTNNYSQLAVNKLAIFDKGKEYIVAYYPLNLDVKSKTLMIRNDLIINKSFLIGENKVSLASYLTINQMNIFHYYILIMKKLKKC